MAPVLDVFFEQKINSGMKKDLTELYSFIDDFCKIYSEYEKKKLLPSLKQRQKNCQILLSEQLTIMIMYHNFLCKKFQIFL